MTPVRQAFPRDLSGWRDAAAALINAGRVGEAEALLTEGWAKLPTSLLLQIEHARVAAKRQDWRQALARWDIMAAGTTAR